MAGLTIRANVYTDSSTQWRLWNFAWDERKDRLNRRKHGISFDTAALVFDDPYQLTRQDREVDGEARWQTIGLVDGVYLLLVAHTVAEGEDEGVIRIISARKATRSERKLYAQGKQGHYH